MINNEMADLLEPILEIGIETTDAGPFEADVFWRIQRRESIELIPQESNRFKLLMDAFQGLEGFDWEAFVAAMSSSENRYFPCWRRTVEDGHETD